MLKIEQLLRATTPDVINSKSRYLLDKVSYQSVPHGYGMTKISANVNGGEGPQKCSILVYSDKMNVKADCVVKCSCKLFKMKLQFVLASYGSAENDNQNVPKETNPQMIPGLCPHLVTLIHASIQADQTKQEKTPQVKISNKLKR
jgi:hypothetical protein